MRWIRRKLFIKLIQQTLHYLASTYFYNDVIFERVLFNDVVLIRYMSLVNLAELNT